jgi:2-methylisocitrate lyase-like PEP mutase family enzyme
MEGQVSIKDILPKRLAVASSRKDEDLVLIVRTDAIPAEGSEKVIRRRNRYVQEGQMSFLGKYRRPMRNWRESPN